MSKVPSLSIDLSTFADVKPGKPSAAIKESAAQIVKGDGALVLMPVEELNVLPDLNVRVTGKDWQARVDEIAADIKAHGFMQTKPLTVFTLSEKGEDGKAIDVVYVAGGHTRLAAAKKAVAEGAKLTHLPVVFMPTGTTPEQAMGDMIRDNSGEPLSAWEQATLVSRMAGLHTLGNGDDAEPDTDKIASVIGKTKRYVQDLLVLSTAPSKLRNAIIKGEIAATVAMREIRASGPEKAEATILKAIEKAKAAGKGKVTPTALKGKEKKTGKKAKAERAASEGDDGADDAGEEADPKAAPEGAPSDAAFLKSALTYAVEHAKAADGVAWAKKFLADDKKAVEELEKWMGQPAGSYFDPSLRVAEDSEDMSDL